MNDIQSGCHSCFAILMFFYTAINSSAVPRPCACSSNCTKQITLVILLVAHFLGEVWTSSREGAPDIKCCTSPVLLVLLVVLVVACLTREIQKNRYPNPPRTVYQVHVLDICGVGAILGYIRAAFLLTL